MISTITVTVPADGSVAKSGFINTRQLLTRVDPMGVSPIVSLIFGDDLDGTETNLRWYSSADGAADSEVPIYDEANAVIESLIGASRGVEVDAARFLRWPYLMVELRTDAAVVPHVSDREITLVIATF